MAKAKSAEAINEGIETAFRTGTEALKVSFEKAVKNYDQFLGYGKDTVEIYAYSKQSIEDSIAAAKALLGSKSVHEAFELQTDYAKSAFDAYVSELTKLSELVVSTTKETFEPIQGRVAAWVEVVQTTRPSA